MVIPARFDKAESFNEGLAAVEINGKYGFIDKTGQMIIQPQYSFAQPASSGLVKVYTGDFSDGNISYIDLSGKVIWPHEDKK